MMEKKGRIQTRFIGALAILSLLIVGCDYDTEPDGPSLFDRFAPLELFDSLEVSAAQVDFSQGQSVSFSAEFNKSVPWVITVTGQTSGAVKIIEGFDRFISVENATWNGTTTNLPFFKSELCSVVLSVDDESNYTDSLSVEIIGTRNYPGGLVTDWENGVNPGFIEFAQSGANMRFDTVVSPSGSVQGNVFYETSGEVAFADDLGNIAMPKEAFTDPDFIMNSNPDLVYFNVFARKGPDAAEDIYVFQIMEDDDGNGTYNPNADDAYEYVIQNLTLDWEQYSINYSELTTFNASGGGEMNPDRIIRVVVLPIGLGEPFEGFLDYLVFSENGPFMP
jgi:hypothetical protein